MSKIRREKTLLERMVYMAKKIAMIGAGAMGSVLGSFLQKGGADIVLVDPDRVAMDAIRDHGLILHSNAAKEEDAPEVVHMKTAYDAGEIGIMDYVIVMVKGTITKMALEGAMPAIDEHTYVVTTQNGLGNEDVIAEKIAKDHILVGCLEMASIAKAPGEVYGNLFDTDIKVHLGCMEETEEGKEAVRVLAKYLTQGGAKSELDEDIHTARWAKFMVNCLANPVLGLVRYDAKTANSNPDFTKLIIALAQEGLQVAAADGAKLDFPMLVTKVLPQAKKNAGDHLPSMAQDMMIFKKRTEIDTLNGHIVDLGKKYGIPTPYHETITYLVRIYQSHYEKQYYPE